MPKFQKNKFDLDNLIKYKKVKKKSRDLDTKKKKDTCLVL